jgi:hypothetical protein
MSLINTLEKFGITCCSTAPVGITSFTEIGAMPSSSITVPSPVTEINFHHLYVVFPK